MNKVPLGGTIDIQASAVAAAMIGHGRAIEVGPLFLNHQAIRYILDAAVVPVRGIIFFLAHNSQGGLRWTVYAALVQRKVITVNSHCQAIEIAARVNRVIVAYTLIRLGAFVPAASLGIVRRAVDLNTLAGVVAGVIRVGRKGTPVRGARNIRSTSFWLSWAALIRRGVALNSLILISQATPIKWPSRAALVIIVSGDCAVDAGGEV